jgi:hypothetical protein
MLNAVWVAVIIAAAFWVVVACAAVYLMVRAARLISQATAAVATAGERQDALIERANATIDQAIEQLVRTDAITASMDEVTANMAELTGRVTALAPLARVISASAGSPVAKAAALAYGVNRALWMRRPASATRAPGAASATGATGAAGAARPATSRARALPSPPGATPPWRAPARGGRHKEVAP